MEEEEEEEDRVPGGFHSSPGGGGWNYRLLSGLLDGTLVRCTPQVQATMVQSRLGNLSNFMTVRQVPQVARRRRDVLGELTRVAVVCLVDLANDIQTVEVAFNYLL